MKTTDIQKLIEELIKVQKQGGKTIQYKGTILCPEVGNSIILTTEPQI